MQGHEEQIVAIIWQVGASVRVVELRCWAVAFYKWANKFSEMSILSAKRLHWLKE